jgi:hypothetical protein
MPPLPREVTQLLGSGHVRSALLESPALFASGAGDLAAQAPSNKANGHAANFNLFEMLFKSSSRATKAQYQAAQRELVESAGSACACVVQPLRLLAQPTPINPISIKA